jgi:SnoaL-like domain
MGDDEAEVRAAAEQLIAAFGSGRLDDYFGCFTDEASFIFHNTPERLESVDAYRRLWDRWVREDDFRVAGCLSSALVFMFSATRRYSFTTSSPTW